MQAAKRPTVRGLLALLRRPAALLLLGTLLFAQTELQQLFRLPVLVEHYLEHRAENPELSFLGFLSLHYFNGDPHDADYARDMQLPFKTPSGTLAAFAIAPLPAVPALQPALQLHPEPVSHRSVYLDWVPAGARSTIWQPPRQA